MKPYLYLSIALGGFVTAIGTGAIVSAEYHVARTGQQVVASIMAPRVYSPINLTRDDSLTADEVASNVKSEMAYNQLASLDKIPAPDVDVQSIELEKLQNDLVCAKEQARAAERARERAERRAAHREAHIQTPHAMVATYGYSIPTPAKAPKGYTFFTPKGRPMAFRVDPKFAQFTFDSKKFDQKNAQFVLQMKSDEKLWKSMSKEDLAQLARAGVQLKSLGDMQEIRIDAMKAAAAATEHAGTTCPEASKDLPGSDIEIVSSK